MAAERPESVEKDVIPAERESTVVVVALPCAET